MASTAVDAQCLDSYRNFTLRLRDGNRTYSGNVRTGLFPRPKLCTNKRVVILHHPAS
jgi:hypothetical protein